MNDFFFLIFNKCIYILDISSIRLYFEMLLKLYLYLYEHVKYLILGWHFNILEINLMFTWWPLLGFIVLVNILYWINYYYHTLKQLWILEQCIEKYGRIQIWYLINKSTYIHMKIEKTVWLWLQSMFFHPFMEKNLEINWHSLQTILKIQTWYESYIISLVI